MQTETSELHGDMTEKYFGHCPTRRDGKDQKRENVDRAFFLKVWLIGMEIFFEIIDQELLDWAYNKQKMATNILRLGNIVTKGL